MTIIDWLYVLVWVVAAVVTVVAGVSVKMPAIGSRWRRGFYLAVALLIGLMTLMFAHTTQARVIGCFIAGMMLIFVFWRQGLSEWAIIAGLGSTRIWGAVTKIELHRDKDVTQLEAFVGSIRVSRLRFKQQPGDLRTYMVQYIDPKKVSVV
ncbi:hypothetical protein PQ472_08015 [Lacticaseibacillus pabuli]|uniref:Uncharacterized protein n=1 Tax=Lacticaseibacillus pabuli TaxID=3025672 RepID=A0ABY7WNW1_9LACO|nr:hypothetical protein [Lacticaseibacillus sp. KACC 23028]WDF81870.1 hypothetical protein PQ472_08015 [Lacticaseibacillus sp. KACC 23028]